MTPGNTLKKFLNPIYEYPRDYFWNIFQALILSGYAILSLELTRAIILSIQGKESDRLTDLFIVFGIASIGLTTSRFLLYKTGCSPIMHNGMMRSIREYMRKYVHAEGSAVEKIGTGRFLTTIDKGLHDWYDLLFQLTFYGVVNIAFIFYTIYTIFVISPLAGGISVAIFILSGIVGTLANFWMREKRNLRRDAYKEALHNLTIMIMSRNELLQNETLYEKCLEKICLFLSRAGEYHHRVVLGFLVMEEFPRLMMFTIRIGLYIFIANGLWEGRGGFADFAIFITIIALAEKGLNEFLNLMRDTLRQFTTIELLWNTFDSLPPIEGYSTGNTYRDHPGAPIEIRDMSFSYEHAPIFSHFSLTIERGQRIALVGGSGGGKTTLMKLIAGYLAPHSGSISVFGNILSETTLQSYYPKIGYLTQDPSVFDGTIRENLVSAIPTISVMSTESRVLGTTRHRAQAGGKIEPDFSLRSASLEMTEMQELIEQELIDALRLAHCDFVFEMEHGLDTEIGEKGIRLSGGQKQRLAIAKIFLKDPEIILLDEPTSALDSFSEEKITASLDTLFEGRTVIIIAHRLQTVRHADDIIVIEDGAIVERGTHQGLVATGGIYAKMLELQSGF